MTQHSPAAKVEGEPVGTEDGCPTPQAVGIDDLAFLLPGWLVADVMIAGNGVDRRPETSECRMGERHFLVAVGTIDAEIAAHDDRVGRQPIDEFAGPAPVVPEEAMRGLQMRIGNRDNARHGEPHEKPRLWSRKSR